MDKERIPLGSKHRGRSVLIHMQLVHHHCGCSPDCCLLLWGRHRRITTWWRPTCGLCCCRSAARGRFGSGANSRGFGRCAGWFCSGFLGCWWGKVQQEGVRDNHDPLIIEDVLLCGVVLVLLQVVDDGFTFKDAPIRSGHRVLDLVASQRALVNAFAQCFLGWHRAVR